MMIIGHFYTALLSDLYKMTELYMHTKFSDIKKIYYVRMMLMESNSMTRKKNRTRQTHKINQNVMHTVLNS